MNWNSIIFAMQATMLALSLSIFGLICFRYYKRKLQLKYTKTLTKFYYNQLQRNPHDYNRLLRDTAYKFSIIQLLSLTMARRAARLYSTRGENETPSHEAIENLASIAAQIHLFNDRAGKTAKRVRELHDSFEVYMSELESELPSDFSSKNDFDKKIISLEEYRFSRNDSPE